jgi:hypothetical protein
MQWLRLILLCLAIAPVALATRNLEWIAITRFGVTLVFMPTLFFAVGRTVGVSPRDYASVLWRPLIASGLMAPVIWLANSVLPLPQVVRLGVDVGLGSVTFAGCLIFLWLLSGRPDSAEKDLLAFLRQRLAKTSRGGVVPLAQERFPS